MDRRVARITDSLRYGILCGIKIFFKIKTAVVTATEKTTRYNNCELKHFATACTEIIRRITPGRAGNITSSEMPDYFWRIEFLMPVKTENFLYRSLNLCIPPLPEII